MTEEILLGAVVEGGSSIKRKTADWRIFRPVINQDKCIRCYICWMYCPEPSILIVDESYTTSTGKTYNITFKIDYEFCKGCGICVEECPVKAIDFIEEVR